MNKTKIINDPIYGFVTFADNLLIRVIDHCYFQRLHRINQLGLAHFVFPGATHTRLHHSIGAFYLMQTALNNLRNKGVVISEKERLACSIAILLHDSGHTPLSHTLEHIFLGESGHEPFSATVIEHLGQELALYKPEREIFQLAGEIFQNKYHRPFFYQLISSQIDVDRMDYLTRDSFYTGVAEGIIGYKRILQTFQVDSKTDSLLIEDKGIYAVEKFLIARYFMHRQVYLHKNVWLWGMLVRKIFERVIELLAQGQSFPALSSGILQLCLGALQGKPALLANLMATDDYDIWFFLKNLEQTTTDSILRILSVGILQRNAYKIASCAGTDDKKIVQQVINKYSLSVEEVQKYLVFRGLPEVEIYSPNQATELGILFKDSKVAPISEYYALLKHLPEQLESPERTYCAYPVC